MFCQSFFLLALFIMLLHYLFLSDCSDLLFPYFRCTYRSQKWGKIGHISQWNFDPDEQKHSMTVQYPDSNILLRTETGEDSRLPVGYCLKEIVLQHDERDDRLKKLKNRDWSKVMVIRCQQFIQRSIITKYVERQVVELV